MNLDTQIGRNNVFNRLMDIKKERGIKQYKVNGKRVYWASQMTRKLKNAWDINKHRSRSEWKQIVENAVQEALAHQEGKQMATQVTTSVDTPKDKNKRLSEFAIGDIVVGNSESVGVKVTYTEVKWFLSPMVSTYSPSTVFTVPASVDIKVTL